MIYTTPLVRRARTYAIKAHGDQKYGDEFPYAVHLQAVESVLIRFGSTTERALAGAWMHDVLEDTLATYDDMLTIFGPEITDDVAAVTEPKGGNRAWRHEQTYPKIVIRGRWAQTLKMADRIANIEFGGKQVAMYKKEHGKFKDYLYTKNGDALQISLQEHLDDLVASL